MPIYVIMQLLQLPYFLCFMLEKHMLIANVYHKKLTKTDTKWLKTIIQKSVSTIKTNGYGVAVSKQDTNTEVVV